MRRLSRPFKTVVMSNSRTAVCMQKKMGEIVTDRLDESFNNLMNYDFTADLEGQLDKVADGERNWKELLDSFYGDFKKTPDQCAR